jgi:hypothetical protein
MKDQFTTEKLIKPFEDFYSKGNWDEAVKLLEPHAAHNGWVAYNLGVVYLKKNQLATARYYFELAKKDHFAQNLVDKNIQFTTTQLGTSVVERGDLWQQSKDFFFQPLVWQCCNILSVALCLYLFYGFWKQKFETLKKMVLSLSVLFIVLCLQVSHYFYEDHAQYAIVTEEATLYEGPSDLFAPLGKLPQGLKVQLTETRDHEWVYISKPTDFVGWAKWSPSLKTL